MDHFLTVIGQARSQVNLIDLEDFLGVIHHNPERIVVVGRNPESEWLLGHFPIRGILDDFLPDDLWHGHRVLRTEDLREMDMIINCSSSISPVAVNSHLDEMNFRYVAYANLAAFEHSWPVPQYISETHASFASHLSDWRALLHLLDDETSKRQFRAVCAFRLTGDPRYLAGFALRIDEQYMEDFILAPLNHPVFLDIGGYHGETSRAFCERVPDYTSVAIYEPSSHSAKIAQAQTSHLRDVTVIGCGVGESTSWERFADNGSTSSMFSRSGEEKVRVVSLDAEGLATVDLIKMDIEGWELPALRGGRELIKRTQPALAIACYHHGSDPIAILSEVLSLNENYTVRFRHYTQGWSESVLFFCPRTH